MNNTSATFPLCILEEIGFEGLEGITIEGLWKRISVRIKVQLPLRELIKKQTWDFILGAKCLRFYLLPEERDPLKLFDRTEASDPFFGGADTETVSIKCYLKMKSILIQLKLFCRRNVRTLFTNTIQYQRTPFEDHVSTSKHAKNDQRICSTETLLMTLKKSKRPRILYTVHET